MTTRLVLSRTLFTLEDGEIRGSCIPSEFRGVKFQHEGTTNVYFNDSLWTTIELDSLDSPYDAVLKIMEAKGLERFTVDELWWAGDSFFIKNSFRFR